MSVLDVPPKITGIGKYVSLLLFTCYFTVIPQTFKFFWPTFIETFNPKVLHLLQACLLNFFILGSYNLMMYFIYRAKHPFFEKYRVHNKPWPWEQDYQKWKGYLKKTIGVVLFNMFILNGVFTAFDVYTSSEYRYAYTLEDWPTTFEMVSQFFFFLFVEDTAFFWSHYLFHSPKLYWIHKQHHEYNITITLAATYAHPIEYLLGNGLPFGIGYRILCGFTKVHLVTIMVWTVYRLLETCEGHSGYAWTWGQLGFVPWKLGSEYHDFHHSANVGNYGSQFGFWDNFMQTNSHYKKAKMITNKTS